MITKKANLVAKKQGKTPWFISLREMMRNLAIIWILQEFRWIATDSFCATEWISVHEEYTISGFIKWRVAEVFLTPCHVT